MHYPSADSPAPGVSFCVWEMTLDSGKSYNVATTSYPDGSPHYPGYTFANSCSSYPLSNNRGFGDEELTDNGPFNFQGYLRFICDLDASAITNSTLIKCYD